jgi:HSP20 family protein
MYTTKNHRKNSTDLFPQIDRVLNEIFNTSINHFVDEKQMDYSQPKANVIEFKDRFVIDLMVPGMSKEDVKLNVDKYILTISADKQLENDLKYKLAEFKYGKFERKFKLPNNIDISKLSAELKHGILSITLHKRKEDIDNGPRDIEIS